ncbi:hypothetical protein [Microvirga brassicacearum]|uniref:Uncharacterized protein n=1 Tax=Microvirga brassicacearum TaxID=2580413 RepID=A0A5N3PH20_9HYPH|nr:hypothetical protein [Microvirga brassicacearum]KAB0269008.1 hypothetical protein FEZ63_02560 [Microvirga brassicacearum]
MRKPVVIWPEPYPRDSTIVDLGVDHRRLDILRPERWENFRKLSGLSKDLALLDPFNVGSRSGEIGMMVREAHNRGFRLVIGMAACREELNAQGLIQ